MYKGNETSLFDAGRIVSVEKITDLSAKLERQYAFSVYVRPKSSVAIDVVISATAESDPAASEIPCECNAWSTVLLKSIEANALELANYDLYLGYGLKTK